MMNRKQFIYQLFQMNEISDKWVEENEKDLKQIIGYIWNAFIYTPRAIQYLNTHYNNYDFNSFTLKDKVKFIHFIIKQAKLLPSWLNAEYQPRVDRIKDMEKYREVEDNDKRSLWHLAKEFGLFDVGDVQERFKKSKKLSSQEKKEIENIIDKHEQRKSQTLVLKELTQEIIDEQELSLIDVSVLETVKQIQYVFINKFNEKVIYREPYRMGIKFHPSTSIFEKDYFEPFENLYEYVFTDPWDYQKFRKALNNAFLNSLKV